MSSLPTLYQQYIHKGHYARWIEEEKRRENWDETVSRYFDFMSSHLSNKFIYSNKELLDDLEFGVLSGQYLPSMRALCTAGPALERDSTCGFNCAYTPIESLRDFDEILYILSCGTGVGFSVEEKYISKLPVVNEHFEKSATTIIVEDSKAGWARALRELMSMLWSGQIPSWDLSRVRKQGERLKIFGGRASGPGPLNELFQFVVSTVENAAGRRLTALEVHDIVCKIAEVIVMGGVRRSATISFSDLDNNEMARAKTGAWYNSHVYRRLANNSAVYESKPSMSEFMVEWKSLYDSKSGERGIFNAEAAIEHITKKTRRDPNYEFRGNPCMEIFLRPRQFCNLTTVVVRPDDLEEMLVEKVRAATILGTFQSTLTDFKYLRKTWKSNTEEERLLGVSLVGAMSHPALNGSNGKSSLERLLSRLKQEAINANAEFSKALGINPSVAITCIKPEGTTSQLMSASSGMHKWWSKYYIRSVRVNKVDPVYSFMKDAGVPCEDDITAPKTTAIFYFPIKAPDGALTRHDSSAIEELELWKTYNEYWCEHKPSMTVNIKEHEWMEVGAWVYKNFDKISGLSFMPYDDHIYKQAPYQDCTKEEYLELLDKMPKSVDWNDLSFYEEEDMTTSGQEFACAGNVCEIVDLVDQ